MSRSKNVLTLCGLFLCLTSVHAGEFDPSCDGHRMPELEAQNPKLKCAVLIDDDLSFPRNIATHNGDIWLIDKGSNLFENGKKNGVLYRYIKKANGYLKRQVLGGLDDPNDLAIRRHEGGESWLYFTTRHAVQRFKITPAKSSPAKSSIKVVPQTIIDNIPTYGWHKLLAIHISPDSLFLTVPSSTDHCETENIAELVTYPCREEQQGTGQIRRYTFDGDGPVLNYTVIATGLRDALAVQLTPDAKKLIVADNGWDQVNLDGTEFEYATTPRDEINIIDLAKMHHFGWPYCFDNSIVTPPYRRFVSSCDAYQASNILLDAHSAPLSMMYFGDELLVNLHGNNDSGAKTIAFSLNEYGLPIAPPRVKVNWSRLHSGVGRPLGLAELSNTKLLVTDDWNHQLIKLVFKTAKNR